MTAPALPASGSSRRGAATEAATSNLAGLVMDPVWFARGILGQDTWGAQDDILYSVRDNPRTAVKACHSSSKTRTASIATLWWPIRYPDGVVITTAPTWSQVERLLWGEVRAAAPTSRIALPRLNQTELPIGPNNYAVGLSTNEGVRFQGFHGRILIIVDEAPGVLPAIFEAMEGIRAGGWVHVLMLGNPTMAGGEFHRAFTSERAYWERFTLSAFSTPNFDGVGLHDPRGLGGAGYTIGAPGSRNLLAMGPDELAADVRPYLTRRSWVREKYATWGPGNPLWEARVLGEFPSQSESAVVALAHIDVAAKTLAPADNGRDAVTVGIDVAGPGEDETAVCVVRDSDGAELALRAWADADPFHAVLRMLAPYRGRITVVNYDEIGTGHHFGRALAREGLPVRGVNVTHTFNSSPREFPGAEPGMFKDLKAFGFFHLRDRAAAGTVSRWTDETANGQLAGIRWDTDNPKGLIQVEDKPSMRKRGLPSPDRAEARMLAYLPPVRAVPAVRVLSTPSTSSSLHLG